MTALVVALGGCGSSQSTPPNQQFPGAGGAGGASGPVQVTSGPFEPLAVNATWTYHVNDSGVRYDKTSTVQALEDAGGPDAGINAFRLLDQFPTQTQLTWYQVDGLVVKRLHDSTQNTGGVTTSDDWYAPFRLRVDETPEHMVAGATWSLSFTDSQTSSKKPPSSTMKTDNWRVDGVDEVVSVPAGTFQSLHVSRTDPSDGSVKSFWFVRGVGKVQETGSGGHAEELASYQLP